MMITKDEIREILSAKSIMALPDEANDDTEIVIDSLTLIYLQTTLEDKFGIQVDPSPEDLELFNSVTGIYSYLTRQSQEPAGGQG